MNGQSAEAKPDAVALTASERRQLRVAWVQATAAIVALIISTYTFYQQVGLHRDQQRLNKDQQELNQQQHRLNEYARVRDERKYSSRVEIWTVASNTTSSTLPRGVDLFIQNRSPVPLRNVHVYADLAAGQTGKATLVDIAP